MKAKQRIVPGRQIGPFCLGEAGEELARLLSRPTERQQGAVRVIQDRDVSLFVEDGVLTQIGVHGRHAGATEEGLRLGITLGEVAGTIMADASDGVLVLAGVAGLCFTTDTDVEQLCAAGAPIVLSREDRISWIGVFVPEPDARAVLEVVLE